MAEKIYRAFHPILSPDAKSSLSRVAALTDEMRRTWAPRTDAGHDAPAGYERDFLSRFAYHTTAIEGSTLTPLETELVLEGEFIPTDDKSLQNLFSARGVAEGYDYALRQLAGGREPSVALVQDIHERTALDCRPRARGTLSEGHAGLAEREGRIGSVAKSGVGGLRPESQ